MNPQINSLFSFADVAQSGWTEKITGIRWPCSYNAYDSLRFEFTRDLNQLPQAYAEVASGPDVFGDADDKSAAMWLALGLMLPTLTQVSRYAIETAHAMLAGEQWVGSCAEMPLLQWLVSNSNEPPPGLMNADLAAHQQKMGRLGIAETGKRAIKRSICKARLFSPWNGQAVRLVTASPLFEHFHRQGEGDGIAPILVDRAFLGLDRLEPISESRSDDQGIAEFWSELAIKPIAALNRQLAERLTLFARHAFSATISIAWRDMAFIRRRIPRRQMGELLCSGTPKHAGRVLSWWYRCNGLPVYRFGHGGDRGTHIDPGWDLVEMPFCSRYFGHGALERDALTGRARDGSICSGHPETPVFDSRGSSKHQAILESALSQARRLGDGKRLLYVTGRYGSELVRLSPVFKTPDHLYAEWQLWFINALRDRGYEVTIKMHPRDRIAASAALDDNSCRRIGGYLDLAQIDYDCLLFDFPGSAWFDTLASNAAMVMADIGPRRLDPRSSESVQQRCPHVPAYQDERNLLRIDMNALELAIGAAQERPGCDEAFAQKLFWQ